MSLTDALQALTDREIRGCSRCETIVCLCCGAQTVWAATGSWQGRPVDGDTPFHTASASKLLGTALAFRMVSGGLWRLDDPVASFFPPGMLDGLHRWRGRT